MDHQKNQPSVKLHQAPGGKSNFSLGWGSEEPTAAAVKKPVAPSPFATDEEQKDQASVKVHAAPGGGSSLQLGDGSATDYTSSSKAANAQNSQGEGKLAAGQRKKEEEEEQQQNQKVRAPPGGKSSITF